jgi:uncharacterized membrane protein YbhN (UPF0104 family)
VSDAASHRRWLWLVAWVVATVLLAVLARTVDAGRLARTLAHVDARWLVVAVCCNLLIQPCGAMQWRAFLPDVRLVAPKRMLRFFALTSVANNTTPSLIGHATGVLLLASEPGMTRGMALSVLAVDQIAVGLVKVAVLLTASLVLPLPRWMHQGLLGLAFAVAALVAGVMLLSRHRWGVHLTALQHPARFLSGAGFAVCVRVCEGLAIASVQHAFGLGVTFTHVLVVVAATALGTLVPIAPANLGTYEAASYGAYRFLGLSSEAALSIAVVQHVCQLIPAVGVGYCVLTVERLVPRRR